MVGSMIVISIALPYMIPILFLLVYVFGRLRRYYVKTSTEVRRYDGTTRSSVYAMLSSNIKVKSNVAYRKNGINMLLS